MKEFIEKTIQEAGLIAKGYFEKQLSVTRKTADADRMYVDVVTEADVAVNTFLSEKIHNAYPTHTITNEEIPDVKGSSEYEWVIDPIDGTYDFAHKTPTWGIIIAVLKSGSPYLSAVYFPMSDQLFFADEERSYLNGAVMKIESTQRIDKVRPRIFTMKPHGPYGVAYERFQRAASRYFSTYECMPKQFGGASSQVYLVTQVFEFSIGNGGMDWDFLAPVHIIRNAGGIVTDSHGKQWERGMQEFVASTNQVLHEQVLELFE